ncbi:MAG: NHL repeat-containing protein [Pirellulaceae bacterium]
MTDNQKNTSVPAGAASSTSTSPRTSAAKIGGAIIAVLLIVVMAVGAYALTRIDTWGERNTAVPQRFQLDLDAQVHIAPEQIGYIERLHFDTLLQEPQALATSADGSIFVAGDRAVLRFRPDGQQVGKIALDHPPTCLAVEDGQQGAPGRVYVGGERHVSVFRDSGEPISQWPELGEKSMVTAIAVGSQHVLVADAGQRAVLVCDPEGREIGRLGVPDPDRHMPGFILPSPYFDLVTGPDEVVWVVNPGMRRVESYSFSGELQAMWGRGGGAIADFFGCCNPAHLASMPDGRFVTSEKGIPRIKVYSEAGEFQCVVAGPSELGVSVSALVDARGDQAERIFDVAVARDGAILALDSRQRTVRVFYPKEQVEERK